MKFGILFSFIIFSWADVLIVDVPASEYTISDNTLIVENGGHFHSPGAPNVPCRKVTIALPPGAIFESVEFYGTYDEIGYATITPMLPALPLVNEEDIIAKIWESYEKLRDRIYSSDRIYPETYGVLLSKGGLRKYSLIDVVCYHFAYRPRSQRLYYTPNIRVEIRYTMPASASERAQFWQDLMNDITFDDIAKEAIYNWEDAKAWYHTDSPKRARGYTIIIPASLQSAVDGLVTYRQSQGFDVDIVTKEYIQSNVAGSDLTQKIRNYLRANTADIEYVLLVGNSSDIPMRYIYPWNNDPDSPYNSWDYSPIPSDLYYAELTDNDSLSWNSDRDALYGEVYTQNFEPYGDDDPDYYADVHLGRIPLSNQDSIEVICDKEIGFDSNSDLSYKGASLLAGALYYYENENYGGGSRNDGADYMEELMNDGVLDRVKAVYLYEKGGLGPCPYACADSLTRANMISYWQRKGVMYECHHGASDRYARKVWAWDDGDSVPENHEITWPDCLHRDDVYQLDNDYPATTVLRSCLCGKPEVTGLGAALLHNGSSAVISSSRVAWMSGADRGGIPYHFYNRLMKDTTLSHGIIGNACDLARTEFMDSCGFWIPAYHYNLWGDPALHQFGTTPIAVEESNEKTYLPTFSVYPNPTRGTVIVNFLSIKENRIELDVYDESGRLVQHLYKGCVDEGHTELDTDLPTGVYFLKLKDGDSSQVRKFIVTR